MEIISPAFEQNQPIPKKFTGEGEDVSPPLNFEGIPAGTKSLALIVEDPDAPMGTFEHWLVWNISPETQQIAEGGSVPRQGRNDFGVLNYRGPLPPPGNPHRYHFIVYALDLVLKLPDGSDKAQLLSAMHGHIIAKAELIGTYKR